MRYDSVGRPAEWCRMDRYVCKMCLRDPGQVPQRQDGSDGSIVGIHAMQPCPVIRRARKDSKLVFLDEMNGRLTKPTDEDRALNAQHRKQFPFETYNKST